MSSPLTGGAATNGQDVHHAERDHLLPVDLDPVAGDHLLLPHLRLLPTLHSLQILVETLPVPAARHLCITFN